jgi:hypothetical protein
MTVQGWLAKQPKDLFSREIYVLVERWRRCAERGGDYSKEEILTYLFFPISHCI